MNSWRNTYETKYGVRFYKYVVTDGKEDIKTKYKIENAPTVVFFRDGEDIDRIDNFEESDPFVQSTTEQDKESNDEKKLKEKIVALCESK